MQEPEVPVPITRSGFVGLLGRPNVGKSTLLNRILGQKIVITSPRPQTTRNRIVGVLNRAGVQMVFFDTPGVHEGEKLINRYMVKEATTCVPELDVVVFLADASHPPHRDDELLARLLAEVEVPILLVLNKVDVGCVPALFFEQLLPVRSTHRVSALTGEGVEELVAAIAALLPEGPEYYPEDALTDRTERFIAQEFIREKVFELTGEEVPYSVAVSVDAWKETPETGLVVIHATIHVERESQKAILIGKGGKMIKEIGKRARHELEALLSARVFLDLHVGVEPNWTRDAAALKRFGYEVKP